MRHDAAVSVGAGPAEAGGGQHDAQGGRDERALTGVEARQRHGANRLTRRLAAAGNTHIPQCRQHTHTSPLPLTGTPVIATMSPKDGAHVMQITK